MQDQVIASESLSKGNANSQISFGDARESFQRNSNWWTIFASFDLPDFTPSSLWISKKTSLPVEEVVEALEGLVVLGFLSKSSQGFVPIKGKEFLKFDWNNKTKSEIIEEHAVVSQQILNHMHKDATVAFDHRFIAANKDIVTTLYGDIQAAFEKAFKASQESRQNNDGVYKITFTAVDVIEKHDSNGRSN